jgi:hypothetical protein
MMGMLGRQEKERTPAAELIAVRPPQMHFSSQSCGPIREPAPAIGGTHICLNRCSARKGGSRRARSLLRLRLAVRFQAGPKRELDAGMMKAVYGTIWGRDGPMNLRVI